MFFRMARVAPEKQPHRLPAYAFISGGQGEDMATKKLTYGEQLKHPKWQRKRLEALEKADFTCTGCYDNASTLHVHHKQYFKGRMAWEYELSELAVLCEECHSFQHEVDDHLKRILSTLEMDGPQSTPDACAMLAGWASDGQQSESELFLAEQCPRMFASGQVAWRLYYGSLGQVSHGFLPALALMAQDRSFVVALNDFLVAYVKEHKDA